MLILTHAVLDRSASTLGELEKEGIMINVNAMFESSVRLFGNHFHPQFKLPPLGSLNLYRSLRQMSRHLNALESFALDEYRRQHKSVHTAQLSTLAPGMSFWWDDRPLTIAGVANDPVEGVVYRATDVDGNVLDSISFTGEEVVNLHKL